MGLADKVVQWLSDINEFPYRGPVTAQDIVREFEVSKVAAHKCINRLVEKGALVRFDQDRQPDTKGPVPASYFLAKDW